MIVAQDNLGQKEANELAKVIAEEVKKAFQEFTDSPMWKEFVESASNFRESVRLFNEWHKAKKNGQHELADKLRDQYRAHRAKRLGE